MERVTITHKWNDDPDYEAFARSMLNLLLEFEQNGVLDELIANEAKKQADAATEADDDLAA